MPLDLALGKLLREDRRRRPLSSRERMVMGIPEQTHGDALAPLERARSFGSYCLREHEDSAVMFPYAPSCGAQMFRKQQDMAEACGSRIYFSLILQVLTGKRSD
jgi:hypothetical protein